MIAIRFVKVSRIVCGRGCHVYGGRFVPALRDGHMIGPRRFAVRNEISLLVLFALPVLISGCGPEVADAVGTYERSTAILWEEIRLNKDLTFDQKVRYKDNRFFQISGTWSLEYKRLELRNAFLTYDEIANAPYDSPKEFKFLLYV